MNLGLTLVSIVAMLVTGFAEAPAALAQEQPSAADAPANSEKEKATEPEKPAEPKPEQPKPENPSPQKRINPAAELLGRLNPGQMASFAQLLEQDWQDKPEWANMALEIMSGRPMGPGSGWFGPTDKKYGWTWLKRKRDKNSDNTIERDEFGDDSESTKMYFERLDRDLDGKIGTSDFDYSINQGSGPGAMKLRMSDFLFFRLDTDSNGQITKDELLAFFDRADEEDSSFLTSEDILTALDDGESRLPPQESAPLSHAQMLQIFFNGELGWFEEGPKVGDAAPDFTLKTHDNSQAITLSQSRDKKPVVVIFGSFT